VEADDTTVDAEETSGSRRCTVRELLFRREDGHSPMEESGGLVSRAGGKCMFIIGGMGNYMYYGFTRLGKERRIFRSREWIRSASFKDRAQVGS